MRQIMEEINLEVPGITGAVLTGYIPEECLGPENKRKYPAVLVLPGGGYNGVSPTEKEPVALEFAAAGIRSFTLKYHVLPYRFPVSLCEALLAVEYIKRHAEELCIDSGNISVCGFSAGGHLAGSVAAFWNRDFVKEVIGERGEWTRVNKAVLCYAVLTGGKYAHEGSFQNLLGEQAASPGIRELLSIEKQVTKDFPPTFLWHTADDEIVPVQNSLLMADALLAHGIMTELHIYPKGPHGLSLGNHLIHKEQPYGAAHGSSDWLKKAIDFIYKY